MAYASDAVLFLSDGSYFPGKGLNLQSSLGAEVCFNTAMTGYQEVMTDPSYIGQLVVFSCPHIGNVGVNSFDAESNSIHVKGIILGDWVTPASNHRSQQNFLDWLKERDIGGICSVDTRQVIRKVSQSSQPLQAMIKPFETTPTDADITQSIEEILRIPPLAGANLVDQVAVKAPSTSSQSPEHYRVALIDYGVKTSILKSLQARKCQVTCFAPDSKIEEILTSNPQGVLLSNGPGDPRALTQNHYHLVHDVLQTQLPIMGICFGHQILAHCLGARIEQMPTGHHGINHPIFDLFTRKVLITSQNHEFAVSSKGLPETIEVTHTSLFDQSLAGLRVKDRPIFGIQFHPEANPGPRDADDLFDHFTTLLRHYAKA